MRKVLILLGDVNSGHRSAANALKDVFDEKHNKDYKVTSIDLFEYANVEPFNTSNESYKLFTKNKTLLKINNFLFRRLNQALFYRIFHKYVNDKLFRYVEEILKEYDPDILISVHPIVSMVVSNFKKNEIGFKSVVVITDLVTLMRGWADKNADLITVPTKEGAIQLNKFGISSDKIKFPFFPIESKFLKVRARNLVLRELGIDSTKKIILITGGGGGTVTLFSSIKQTLNRTDLHVIVVCGKDSNLKLNLEIVYGNQKNLKVLGYLNNMQDLINASDIVIAKPGPATILEIESLNKKALFSSPVGEQEKGNVTYLKQNPNFRYYGNDLHKLKKYLELFLDEDEIDYERRDVLNECKKIVEEIINL